MILIHPKKGILIPVLIFALIGCASIGPNTTYYMATTSFKYDPTYVSYMVELNSHEIGAGFGSGMSTSPVKIGPQIITWRDAKTGQVHNATNEVSLTKEDIKGMKYLAVHLYPDDSIEITTSNNWPNPTVKGNAWYDRLTK